MYDWSEEHQAITAVMRRFVDEEIRPHIDELELATCPRTQFFEKCTRSSD
jgi:hypothetical protein